MIGPKKEPLGSYSIYVSEEHTFGTDAVLLADFASMKRSGTVCDLGTGCGIIPLLLLKNHAALTVCGVEIQESAASLAAENARLNALEDVFTVYRLDMREMGTSLPRGTFDTVTCNPPYKAADGGVKNVFEARKIARHEVTCTFQDAAKAAAGLLKFGGRFCVCHRPERLADVICEMRAVGIEPKILREVIQREGGAAWLVLVEGRLGGNRGMTVMPPLYVEKDGVLSEEMLKIYGDYKQGRNV